MKATVIGAQRITGMSDKSGTPQPYDISRLLVLEPIESVDSQNFQRQGVGFSTMEVPCEPELIKSVNGKKFPFEAELVTSCRSRFGRLETVVTSLR